MAASAPKALPKHKLAPITLTLKGTMGTTDGTHVPALKTSPALRQARHGRHQGLPDLQTWGRSPTRSPPSALKTCKKALVGTGNVTAEVQFPDSNPVPASGKLLVFNSAPKGGDPVFIQHAYVSDPVATTVVTVARVTNVHGKYGKATTIQIPPLSGGYGSLTSFTAKLHKDYTYKGKKHSIFLAECANGHFFAHGDFIFTGGDGAARRRRQDLHVEGLIFKQG